jgi:hypothetical protein
VATRQRADFGERFGHGSGCSSIRETGTGPSASILQCTMNVMSGIAASPKGARIETSFDTRATKTCFIFGLDPDTRSLL